MRAEADDRLVDVAAIQIAAVGDDRIADLAVGDPRRRQVPQVRVDRLRGSQKRKGAAGRPSMTLAS